MSLKGINLIINDKSLKGVNPNTGCKVTEKDKVKY